MLRQQKRKPQLAEKPRLDTTRLQKMAQAYWESAALMAAVELAEDDGDGVGHPDDADEAFRQCCRVGDEDGQAGFKGSVAAGEQQ